MALVLLRLQPISAHHHLYLSKLYCPLLPKVTSSGPVRLVVGKRLVVGVVSPVNDSLLICVLFCELSEPCTGIKNIHV